MQRGLTRYDRILEASSSTEEDSCCLPSDIDLLNPRVYQADHHHQSIIHSHRKPFKSKLHVDNSSSTTLRRSSSLVGRRNTQNRNEHQVTFAEAKYSSGEGIRRSKWKLRQERSGTPRIVQAIRRHSGKLKLDEKTLSPRYPKEDKSKSSVVVLYDEDSSGQAGPLLSCRSSKTLVRTSKSEQTVVKAPLPPSRPPSPAEAPATLFRIKESTEPSAKVFLPRRRRIHHRSAFKKHDPVNVNIIQEIQRCQACKLDAGDTRLMAQALPVPQKRIREVDSEGKRVFPFQATPSGNLKIIPNQVVFESKKVSVLVADPRHTKVNVKAEISRPGLEASEASAQEYQHIRQGPIDLPPGVTPSTIDQLQAQQKLPQIGTEYVPRTQPHRLKHRHREMEQKQNVQQPILQRQPPSNEVPLSSLGFTSEHPIDWDNITLPEKTDLYRELARRITNYKNADCIVRLGHDEFHCHLLVLQSYSTFFDEKNCKDIDLTGCSVTSKAFSIIYDWMISPTSESCHLLRRDNILEIFMAAQYLGIKELEEQCWAFIDNDELFSEDTAFLLYLEARKIGNTAVMELMVPRIMKFFLLLVSTKDFLELSIDELCLLLRSNYICVNSEMEVLMSAVRWLMYDWDGRRQYMLDVLKCVRFGLIAPWQLVDVKRNPENPEFMELMSYPEVQKMVDDGLAFVIIKYWYGNQTEDYYHWIDLLGLTEPTNRNWAGEDKNYVTYREFLLYLEEYQKTMMTEFKSKKGKAVECNQNQCSDPPATRSRANCSNHCSCETMSAGQVSVPANNGGRSSKFPKMPSAPPGHATPGAPPGMGMPPEILSKYLSSLSGNSKTEVRGKTVENGVRIGNAISFDTWHTGEMPPRNYQERDCSEHVIANECSRQWEPNIILPHQKKHLVEKKRTTSILYPGDHTDSSRSEKEAATAIQAIYRGYKIRRKLDEIRKASSEENQKTKKVAELLSVSTVNNNRLHKPLEPIRLSTSLASQALKNHDSRKQRSNSPRKRRQNSPTLRNTTQINPEGRVNCPKDLGGTQVDMGTPQPTPRTQKIAKQKDTSIENNSINQAELSKPIQTIKPPTLSYNFEGRMSSASPSDNNTDAETEERSKSRLQINIDAFGDASDNYFPDYSLFFPDREAVLVLGGIDPHVNYGAAGNTGKDMYRFKPLENVWEFVGEIPEPRHHHSVAYLCGRVYLVGGADPREEPLQRKNAAVGTVWSYDPTSRRWFSESEMLTPRKNFGLVVSHGKMFAIGGQDLNGVALRSVEAFDPSKGVWRKMQPMYTARLGPACAKFQDYIWVAGGLTKSKQNALSKEVECYDPTKNMWYKVEPLCSPRCFASLYVVSDCLYVIGGAGTSSTNDSMTESIETIDMWDPNLRTWRQLAEMTTARHSHSTGSIGNQLLIIGGVTTVYMRTLESVECFCCERNKWIKGVASLPYGISGHDSVSLPPSNLLEHF